MQTKMIGGILIIVGTSIGGAMLALPIGASPAGFFPSALLLMVSWLLMTFCAFLVLEVNLWFPTGSNFISMTRATLGDIAAVIALFTYLVLFYALLSAYITGAMDVVDNLIDKMGIHLPHWFYAIAVVLVLGSTVYKGIRSVDYLNRLLMFTKLLTYAFLVASVLGYVKLQPLLIGAPKQVIGMVTLVITSYGFATVVPSLRSYFKDDIKKLRITLLLGSLVPLGCYLLWNYAIMGSLPMTGEHSLVYMLHSGHSNSDLANALSQESGNVSVMVLSNLFTSICVATSFLGVSLGLSDFIADWLGIAKQGWGNVKVYAITFMPPIIIAIFYPGLFIKALGFAGIFCAILLALYPPLMAWQGRYKKNLRSHYQVIGGKAALSIAIMLSVLIIGIGIAQILGF